MASSRATISPSYAAFKLKRTPSGEYECLDPVLRGPFDHLRTGLVADHQHYFGIQYALLAGPDDGFEMVPLPLAKPQGAASRYRMTTPSVSVTRPMTKPARLLREDVDGLLRLARVEGDDHADTHVEDVEHLTVSHPAVLFEEAEHGRISHVPPRSRACPSCRMRGYSRQKTAARDGLMPCTSQLRITSNTCFT